MKQGEERDIMRDYEADIPLSPELFSIRQVCDACGISRAMLIKLENAGFLVPAQVNAKTGYRWYDLYNVSKLQQYQNLRSLGLSLKEIEAVYSPDSADAERVLSTMKDRLQQLLRCIDELSLRLGRQENAIFSVMELPELTCLCGRGRFSSMREKERFTYGLHAEVAKRGLRLLPSEPIFTLREDTRDEHADEKPHEITVCIPIDPAFLQGRNTENVEVIPACHALSLLLRGDYRSPEMLSRAHTAIWAEMDRRGLTADGPLRTLGLLAPYVNIRIETSESVLRFAVPFREEAK